MAIAAAGLAALAAVPTAVAVLLTLLLTSATLDGIGIEGDLGPAQAGVSTSSDGQVVVHPGPCGRDRSGVPVSSIRLLGPHGSVAWQADAAARPADASPPSDTVVIGQAPSGFLDVVPLAGPLDPESTYEVQTSVLAHGAAAASSSSTDADMFAVFGQSATFRPADLDPDAVWYQGRAVTPAAFSQAACDADDGETAAG